MSRATEIAATDDETIREYPPRVPSGVIDYALGQVSVSWRGGDSYVCGACQGNDRWASSEHRGCAHIQRVQRYRLERGA